MKPRTLVTIVASALVWAASACFAQCAEWRQTVSIDGRIADTQRVVVDESLYLVLSQWLANGFLAADRTADLYEAHSGRFTPMRFRLVARGDVEIGDRCVRAVRVEMSLADPVGRLFWPHAYTYWFAADDGRFLAYEGRDQDGRVIRLERV